MIDSNVQTSIELHHCSPDLCVVLMATESHQVSADLPSLLRTVTRQFQIQKYNLGIIEGVERRGDDAVALMNTGLVERATDLFYDPLSKGAFQLFREKYPKDSLELVAAKYVAGWFLYAHQEGYSPAAMDKEFLRVFEGIFPNYVESVVPHIENLQRIYGAKYEAKQEEYLREVIDLVNLKSEDALAAVLKEQKGTVLIYCGSEHKIAVDNALDRTKRSLK